LDPLLEMYPFPVDGYIGGGENRPCTLGAFCPVAAAISDQWTLCASRHAMRGLSDHITTYEYIFSYTNLAFDPSSTGDDRCNPELGYYCHGGDLPFHWNYSVLATIPEPYWTQENWEMVHYMHGSVVNFIYSGNPNDGPVRLDNFKWKAFEHVSDWSNHMTIPPVNVQHYRSEQCALFDDIYGYNTKI